MGLRAGSSAWTAGIGLFLLFFFLLLLLYSTRITTTVYLYEKDIGSYICLV